MPAKKKADKVKLTAVVDFEVDKNEEGNVRLWGIDFKASKGKLTAEVDAELGQSLLDSGKCK